MEAYQILENIALNNCQWPVERVAPKKQAEAYDFDVFTNLAAQVSLLSKQLQTAQQKGTQVSAHMVEESPPSCDHCHGAHPTSQCLMMDPMRELIIEQAQYLSKFPLNQNFNLNAQSYNIGWKNHPIFHGEIRMRSIWWSK